MKWPTSFIIYATLNANLFLFAPADICPTQPLMHDFCAVSEVVKSSNSRSLLYAVSGLV